MSTVLMVAPVRRDIPVTEFGCAPKANCAKCAAPKTSANITPGSTRLFRKLPDRISEEPIVWLAPQFRPPPCGAGGRKAKGPVDLSPPGNEKCDLSAVARLVLRSATREAGRAKAEAFFGWG